MSASSEPICVLVAESPSSSVFPDTCRARVEAYRRARGIDRWIGVPAFRRFDGAPGDPHEILGVGPLQRGLVHHRHALEASGAVR